jgi:hypothetical protein
MIFPYQLGFGPHHPHEDDHENASYFGRLLNQRLDPTLPIVRLLTST